MQLPVWGFIVFNSLVERLAGRGGRLWEVVIDVTGGVISLCVCC